MRQIDLPPQEWKSRDSVSNRREPFFGKGAIPALAWLISFSVVVAVVHYLR